MSWMRVWLGWVMLLCVNFALKPRRKTEEMSDSVDWKKAQRARRRFGLVSFFVLKVASVGEPRVGSSRVGTGRVTSRLKCRRCRQTPNRLRAIKSALLRLKGCCAGAGGAAQHKAWFGRASAAPAIAIAAPAIILASFRYQIYSRSLLLPSTSSRPFQHPTYSVSYACNRNSTV